MFGLNDANAQSTNGNDQAAPAAEPMMHSNPFSDPPAASPAPVSDPSLPAALSSLDTTAAAPAGPGDLTPKADDLLDLKEQALTSLQPLVGHLDQTPEEKFKTTMMLIQATDNSALVKEAYEAANQITDEKARAQALLDVVNEINYFTQHNGDAEDKPPQI